MMKCSMLSTSSLHLTTSFLLQCGHVGLEVVHLLLGGHSELLSCRFPLSCHHQWLVPVLLQVRLASFASPTFFLQRLLEIIAPRLHRCEALLLVVFFLLGLQLISRNRTRQSPRHAFLFVLTVSFIVGVRTRRRLGLSTLAFSAHLEFDGSLKPELPKCLEIIIGQEFLRQHIHTVWRHLPLVFFALFPVLHEQLHAIQPLDSLLPDLGPAHLPTAECHGRRLASKRSFQQLWVQLAVHIDQ
mmetsp:Transcript_32299/g.86510  ORF Transcript_32299/g.86510 Transcript_32299/m.86510 type:complete len:242 (-) Transcript_32299:1393-2118(-)